MERAIVRMHFDDDTFKTFLLVPTTTAGDLVAQVQQKLKTDAPYYLHYSAPGVAGTPLPRSALLLISQGLDPLLLLLVLAPQSSILERYIAPHEQAWPFYKQHGERCRYTFRLKVRTTTATPPPNSRRSAVLLADHQNAQHLHQAPAGAPPQAAAAAAPQARPTPAPAGTSGLVWCASLMM
jgi:hypothetical protein